MLRTAFPKSPLEYLAMKKSILYWAIPIVYIGVIGLFIYLQFSSVDPFSDKIGSITISGTKTSGTFGRTPQIRELTVQYRGLRFTFSGDTPLAVQRDENKPRNLALMEYNRYAAGVELVFEEGVKAAFELGGALGEWMSLRVTLKDGSMCLLPYDSSQVQVQPSVGIPVFSFTSDDDRYHLTLPPGSRIDDKNSYFHIPPSQDGSSRQLIVKEADEALGDPYLFWFVQTGASKSREEYEVSVQEYFDRAYRGWDKERYVMGQGTWRMKGAEARFSEFLARAWIAEALRRGTYSKAAPFISAAMDIRLAKEPTAEFLYLSSPFIGRLMRFKEEYFKRLPQRTRSIAQLIRARDPALFRVDHLIMTILNSNMLSQIDELVSRLVVNLEIEAQDVDISLGLLETYLEVTRWFQEGEIYFNRFREAIFQNILPRIRVINGDPWLFVDNNGLVDVYLCIKAGYLLREIGSLEKIGPLESLGRGLILSSLSLRDEHGFLPRRVRPTAETIREVGGVYIPPEDVYAFATLWPFYPEEKPLYPLYDPGSWLWTAAKLEDLVSEAGTLRFSLLFPANNTHYIMIQGIQSVESVELHGMKIARNLNYQTFINGWHYDERSLTLYIKLFQDNPQEEVVVGFR